MPPFIRNPLDLKMKRLFLMCRDTAVTDLSNHDYLRNNCCIFVMVDLYILFYVVCLLYSSTLIISEFQHV